MDSSDKLFQEIEKLADQNLQSDERFSESYIRSRYNSGFGPSRIKYDLLTRRVTESTINNAFKELDLNWIEKLEKENLKKYGNENPKSVQELSKRIKFFIQRGFEKEMIRKIINL